MAGAGLDRVLATAPGRVLLWVAQRPLIRPVARGGRDLVVAIYRAIQRLRPANRRHDARQRQILTAFEAGLPASSAVVPRDRSRT